MDGIDRARTRTVKATMAAWLWMLALSGGSGAGAATLATPTSLTGTWLGAVQTPGAVLRIAVRLKDEAGALSGVFDRLDQGALDIPLRDVTLVGGMLAFAAPAAKARYEGAWSPTAGRFEGMWRQGGDPPQPLSLKRGDPAKTPLIAGLDGAWDGFLDLGAMGRVRAVLTVKSTDAGTTATFQSPDQSPDPVPVTALARSGEAIVLEVAAIRARFDAVLSSDGRVLAGRWTEDGTPLPLALARRAPGAEEPRRRPRPQTPQPPFPYIATDIGYDNPRAGSHLSGTLTEPTGKGPFPAVVLIKGSGLITGSGPQDRDETLFGHKLFLVLADALTRRGVAVLRVDDRTMGGSTGDVTHATSADFATDVEAGVAFLAKRREIDHHKIGLIGHSEGGLIAPMVALNTPSVAFIVLMAGPGLKGGAIVLEQQRLIALAMRTPGEKLARDQAEHAHVIDAVLAAPDAAAAEKAVVAVLTSQGVPLAQAEAAATQASSDGFRYFLAYDPIPVLRRVRVPVLAIYGSLDLQVPAAVDIAAIRAALVNNKDAVEIEIPGLNHLLQTAKTGAPSEYNKIEETIAPIALTTIGDWVVERAWPAKAQADRGDRSN